MTRKRDRRRRLAAWLLTLGLGAVVAAAIWSVAPHGAVLAAIVIVATLMIGHRRMIGPPGIPILTYHSVSPDAPWLPWADDISVHPDTFERHLVTLRAMGLTVLATRALCAARLAGAPLPANAVVLHFDDGYLDNWLHAIPALDRHDVPATFFVSLDFIEPDTRLRTRESGAEGYMNWAEIAEIARDPRFEVEPHGVDHGRVAISDRVVDTLSADNWRRLAWVQWAATPGPKHDWYRQATPSAVPLGSAVPESALALASPRWRDGAIESEAAFTARIVHDLDRCGDAFRTRLGRTPRIFCWPENKVGAIGRRIAAAHGYVATTGGEGRNTAAESPAILSRLHVGDRALGFRWLSAEALSLRATIRLWQGNFYWYPLVLAMNTAQHIVKVMKSRHKTDRSYSID